MENEKLWQLDLIKCLQSDLRDNPNNINVSSRSILMDLSIIKDKKGDNILQLGLFSQDIVIYKNSINIDNWKNISNLKIHNNDVKHKNLLCIPDIICELKYDGINTHSLITYSNIAINIKSIYPNSKYLLVMLYKNDSSDTKLLRNGKAFDKIIYFTDKKAPRESYITGDFSELIKKDNMVKNKYSKFVDLLKNYINKGDNKIL